MIVNDNSDDIRQETAAFGAVAGGLAGKQDIIDAAGLKLVDDLGRNFAPSVCSIQSPSMPSTRPPKRQGAPRVELGGFQAPTFAETPNVLVGKWPAPCR